MYTYDNYKIQSNRYQTLNSLTSDSSDCVVLFGSDSDLAIPVNELQESFNLPMRIYNRSFSGLKLADAADAYDMAIEALAPKNLIIHLGDHDLDTLENSNGRFERNYMDLIDHIRYKTPDCSITILSLSAADGDANVTKANRILKDIADSTRCAFSDLVMSSVWSCAGTMETVSFLYSTGFVRPLKYRRRFPVDLVIRILYGFENASGIVPAEERVRYGEKASRRGFLKVFKEA